MLIEVLAGTRFVLSFETTMQPRTGHAHPRSGNEEVGATRRTAMVAAGLLAAAVAPLALASAGAWQAEPAPVAARQTPTGERLLIRVAPAGRERMARLADIRWRERRIGNCLRLAKIAGVGVGREDRLLLVMSDNRLIGVELEKRCQTRQFYSGFYVERAADGRLCVGRDMLHARSGTRCSLERLRQLVGE